MKGRLVGNEIGAVGRSSGTFCAGSWEEGSQLGVWHSRKEKMAALTRMVAVEMVRNCYVWICFEGRVANVDGALNVRFEKNRESNF